MPGVAAQCSELQLLLLRVGSGLGARGGGGSALLMPSWRCLGPGGGIWGRIFMDGGRHPLLCTVPGWGRERQRVLGGERGGWGGMMDTAGCAVPPLCLEIWARRSAGVCDPPPPPPTCCFSVLGTTGGGGGRGGWRLQHAVTPFCKGHPRWVVLSGGWGLIPLIPIGWLQWGLGVPRSRRGGGLQGCLCKQTTGGSSSIPGIGTDPAGGPTTPPAPEGWI